MKNGKKTIASRRGKVSPVRRTLVTTIEAPYSNGMISKGVFPDGDPCYQVKGQLRDLSELRWYPIHVYQLESMKNHSRKLTDYHLVSTPLIKYRKDIETALWGQENGEINRVGPRCGMVGTESSLRGDRGTVRRDNLGRSVLFRRYLSVNWRGFRDEAKTSGIKSTNIRKPTVLTSLRLVSTPLNKCSSGGEY